MIFFHLIRSCYASCLRYEIQSNTTESTLNNLPSIFSRGGRNMKVFLGNMTMIGSTVYAFFFTNQRGKGAHQNSYSNCLARGNPILILASLRHGKSFSNNHHSINTSLPSTNNGKTGFLLGCLIFYFSF